MYLFFLLIVAALAQIQPTQQDIKNIYDNGEICKNSEFEKRVNEYELCGESLTWDDGKCVVGYPPYQPKYSDLNTAYINGCSDNPTAPVNICGHGTSWANDKCTIVPITFYNVTGSVKIAFDKYDEDGSGTMEIDELEQMLRHELREPVAPEDFAQMDADGNGVLDFEEFLDWFTSEKILAL